MHLRTASQLQGAAFNHLVSEVVEALAVDGSWKRHQPWLGQVMAREPSYPEEAPIGGKPTGSAPQNPSPAQFDPPPPALEEAKGSDSRRKKHLMAGAAIGIGSAAIVAALLYANRNRGGDKA